MSKSLVFELIVSRTGLQYLKESVVDYAHLSWHVARDLKTGGWGEHVGVTSCDVATRNLPIIPPHIRIWHFIE